MISNGKEFYNLIDSLLKPFGYLKKKNTWYLHTEDCICFFTLEKSSFGGNYEDVMGCFLKEINNTGKDFPEFYKNHLRYGLDDITDKSLVKRVFDLENQEFKGEEREFLVQELMEIYAIPFLKDVSTKQNIKEAILKYPELIYSMNVELKKALSIPFEE